MLAYVKWLRVGYAEHWEERRQGKRSNEQQIQKEFRQTNINHLEQKIKTLEKKKVLDEESVRSMMKAEEKNNINYVVKGNVLKLKFARKKAEIKFLEESLLLLHKKRKKLKF